MAIDKGKLQEEEASAVTRFYNIILGWDYKQLTKENEVLYYHTTSFHVFLICVLNLLSSETNEKFVLYSICFFPLSNSFYVIQRKNRKDSIEKLNVVKSTYKDVDDYFETFEPLLFEEVKAQILQNRDGEEG